MEGLPKIRRVTCFPMKRGETREFCIDFRWTYQDLASVLTVSPTTAKALLGLLVKTAFGWELESHPRGDALTIAETWSMRELVRATLTLLWRQKIRGEEKYLMRFRVSVMAGETQVVSGEYTVVVPA